MIKSKNIMKMYYQKYLIMNCKKIILQTQIYFKFQLLILNNLENYIKCIRCDKF